MIATQRSWVIDGEDRISYTTLTRLVECCREYHWQVDLAPLIATSTLDTTCKSLSAEFLQPIQAGEIVRIVYEVVNIRSRGYEISFHVKTQEPGVLHANYNVVLVFVVPSTGKITVPPTAVMSKLQALSTST